VLSRIHLLSAGNRQMQRADSRDARVGRRKFVFHLIVKVDKVATTTLGAGLVESGEGEKISGMRERVASALVGKTAKMPEKDLLPTS
jgi:hypothetical protein